MTPFIIIHSRAKNVTLDSSTVAYFASPEFGTRIAFNGEQGLRDKLNITLYLLARLALDPRGIDDMQAHLSRGTVLLRYFGISNPVPLFELEVGSVELGVLKAAVTANSVSRMVDAANRVRAWRTGEKSCSRHKHEEAVMGRLRESLAWPDRKAYEANPEKAREAHTQLAATMDMKLLMLRQRRGLRLARLAQATAPSVKDWTGLLEDIALQVLPPLR